VGVVEKRKKKKAAVLLGVGLDSDGHKRLTTGPNFALVGGTQDTHDDMTEKAIKINEKLAAKGKRLEDVSREEFDEIAHAVGLQRRQEKGQENDKGGEGPS
jgi:seryl-tRNA(Sec) selenium transferase